MSNHETLCDHSYKDTGMYRWDFSGDLCSVKNQRTADAKERPADDIVLSVRRKSKSIFERMSKDRSFSKIMFNIKYSELQGCTNGRRIISEVLKCSRKMDMASDVPSIFISVLCSHRRLAFLISLESRIREGRKIR